jgi:hypothetical protein
MNKTITEKTRYIDTGASLRWYRKDTLCVCPTCQGPVLIRGEFADEKWYYTATGARAQCLHCSFNKTWDSNNCEWKGPVIGRARQRCAHCGQKWLKAEVWKKAHNSWIKQTTTIECGFCHELTELQLEWQHTWVSEEAIDPYFGLPLWLQIESCGNRLWAYNKEHLLTLKTYIAAAHRDRKGKWSMATRLPQWIKSAKNREALLKSIAKLETKL